jgi:RNA polymerase sigma-70 factor (ECF subfamily)
MIPVDPSFGRAHFQTTRWSVVLAARRRQATGLEKVQAGQDGEETGGDLVQLTPPYSSSILAPVLDPAAQQALRDLCAAYWQPVYSFLRRLGHSPDDAMDLTQGFLATLLERGHVGTPDPARGRFRTYLLGALRHYLMDQADQARAIKRGGAAQFLPLFDQNDTPAAEEACACAAPDMDSPERAYLRRWGLLTLETARQRLRAAYAADDKAPLFDALADQLGATPNPLPMPDRANQLGLTPEALKMALSRLRRRYGETLRTLIAETVDNPADVDAEIQFLIEAVG